MRLIIILFLFSVLNSSNGQCQSKDKPSSREIDIQACGLLKIELGANLNGFDGYLGYGILTMTEAKRDYTFILATIGLKAKSHERQFYLTPQITLDYPILFIPKFSLYAKVNVWTPIKGNTLDIIVTPQLGYAFVLGFGYLTLGYDINTTNRLNFGNSLNLTFGINIPTKLEKINF